jgi:hypothetical protein
MTGGVAWNVQLELFVCWSRKKPPRLVEGNRTTSALPKASGVCVTGCQAAEETFVVEVNCQSAKLLGHENCREAGGTCEIESVGNAASAGAASVNRHHKRKKRFTSRGIGFNECHPCLPLIQPMNETYFYLYPRAGQNGAELTNATFQYTRLPCGTFRFFGSNHGSLAGRQPAGI